MLFKWLSDEIFSFWLTFFFCMCYWLEKPTAMPELSVAVETINLFESSVWRCVRNKILLTHARIK